MFPHEDANPYSPPSKPLVDPEADFSTGPDLRLFLTWERLRIVYNAVLGVETVLLLIAAPPTPEFRPGLTFYLLAACFGANVCFCLGLVLNGYAELIGLRGRGFTIALFTVGTLFAMLLTIVASISWSGGFVLD